MTKRYETVIRLRVAYDAENSPEAARVAKGMADEVSIPVPRGRSAELLTSSADSPERVGGDDG